MKEILFNFYTTGNKIYIDLYFLFICLFITILLFAEYLNKKKHIKKLLIGFVFLTLASIAHILRRFTNINSLPDIIRLVIFFSFIILSLFNIFSSGKKGIGLNVKNLAVLSLFISILGLFLPLLGIISLLTGIIALHKINVGNLTKPLKYRLFALFGIILGLIVLVSFTFVIINIHVHYETFRARSSAMFPTIKDNNKIIVDRMAYVSGSPERGDIVIFRLDYNEKGQLKCSRIVGLAGEKIEIKKGQVYINGGLTKICCFNTPVDYKNTGDFGKEDQIIDIPRNAYYVLNDNTLKGLDSRYFGPVDRKDIYGKVVLIFSKNLTYREIFVLLKRRAIKK